MRRYTIEGLGHRKSLIGETRGKLPRRPPRISGHTRSSIGTWTDDRPPPPVLNRESREIADGCGTDAACNQFRGRRSWMTWLVAQLAINATGLVVAVVSPSHIGLFAITYVDLCLCSSSLCDAIPRRGEYGTPRAVRRTRIGPPQPPPSLDKSPCRSFKGGAPRPTIGTWTDRGGYSPKTDGPPYLSVLYRGDDRQENMRAVDLPRRKVAPSSGTVDQSRSRMEPMQARNYLDSARRLRFAGIVASRRERKSDSLTDRLSRNDCL